LRATVGVYALKVLAHCATRLRRTERALVNGCTGDSLSLGGIRSCYEGLAESMTVPGHSHYLRQTLVFDGRFEHRTGL
jgi:hypothetical protein